MYTEIARIQDKKCTIIERNLKGHALICSKLQIPLLSCEDRAYIQCIAFMYIDMKMKTIG